MKTSELTMETKKDILTEMLYKWPFYTRALKKYPNVLWTHTADMVASQIKDK